MNTAELRACPHHGLVVFHLSRAGKRRLLCGVRLRPGKGLQKLREEAKKCVLVCANCHGEIESGDIASPPAGATYSRP